MAKIALITENFSPLVESLATALMHQKQEVVLITSRSCLEKIPSHLRAIAPFRRWSALEAMRSLPTLISENFDVWHFLFATPESEPRSAHWLLAGIARGLPQKVVAASFSNVANLKGWRGKFLAFVDLALFAERSSLMEAKRNALLARHTLTEVLPPLESPVTQAETMPSPETGRLLENLRPFLVLPDLVEGPSWLDRSPVDFVVLKAPPRQGSRHKHVFYTGELSANERDLFIQNSMAVCLLYGDYSVIELQRFHQWSEKTRRPLIVRKHQTEIWPGLCWHLKSGWVLGDELEPLQSLLIENPQLKLEQDYQGFSRNELVDSTLNQLLRLYQRSFLQRWT